VIQRDKTADEVKSTHKQLMTHDWTEIYHKQNISSKYTTWDVLFGQEQQYILYQCFETF